MSNKFFKDLKKSLEEVLAHKEGKLDLYSEYIEVPEPPAEYKLKEITQLELDIIDATYEKNKRLRK